MRSGKSEVGLTGDNHLARLLGRQFDWLVRQTFCLELEFDVGPGAVCENDLVTWLQCRNGRIEFFDGSNEIAAVVLRA